MEKDATDEGRSPLRAFGDNDRKDLLSRMFRELRIAVQASGWPAPADWVTGEIELTSAKIQERVQVLSARWTDAYLQEIPAQLAELENDRRYYSEVVSWLATQLIARHEFDQTELIHNDEIAAGWYTLEKDVGAAELAGQNAWSNSVAAVKQIYDDLLSNSDLGRALDHPDWVASLRAATDAVQTRSAYRRIHAENAPDNTPKVYSFMSDPMEHAPNPPDSKVWVDPPGLGNWVDVPTGVHMMGLLHYLPEAAHYVATVKTQGRLSAGSAESASALLKSKAINQTWNEADVGFRRRRSELTVEINKLRRQAMDDNDGPLNYARNLGALKANFINRLAQLVAKCIVAQQGLDSIWGWKGLGSPPVPFTWDDSKGSYLSAIVNWWAEFSWGLNKRLHLESSTIIPISLRRHIGDSAWNSKIQETISKNLPNLQLSFPFPLNVARGLKGLRVRGISSYYSGADEAKVGVFTGTISAPSDAVIVDEKGTISTISQGEVVCDLARIQSRQSVRPADIVGTSLLRNMSPITKDSVVNESELWNVIVDRHSSAGEDITNMSDVQLDFVVMGIR